MSAGDIPSTGPSTTAAALPAVELARMLGNAAPFASDDATLPVLNAVRLRVAGESLIVDATDRYALLRETHPLAGPADPFDVVVPLPAIRQIRQLLAAARRQDGETVAELAVVGEATVRRCDVDHTVPRLRVAAGTMAVEAAGQPGDYPNLDGLIDREDAHAAEHGPGRFDVLLAPRLLARLAKLRTAEDGGNPRARLTQSTGQPAIPGYARMRPVHASLGDRVRVLVMPIRQEPA